MSTGFENKVYLVKYKTEGKTKRVIKIEVKSPNITAIPSVENIGSFFNHKGSMPPIVVRLVNKMGSTLDFAASIKPSFV